MTTTPADPPPWQTGPPEGYAPPPTATLRDPDVQARTAAKGAALVMAVLAEEGITKRDDGKWDTPNREGARP